MEIIVESFCNPLRVIKIKKKIITSMLKRQVWMADDVEFHHIVKNSQRVLKLND